MDSNHIRTLPYEYKEVLITQIMKDVDLLEGLPGLRDYYPEDWKKINYIVNKMREVSKSYGYEEYEGPTIEPVELIEAKSGEGLIREIFQLSDRNERRLLLRPEQTPTLAKMLAREQQRYKRPLRWFSIPRLFRDETVQKGRVREFWQLNVDLLGEDSLAADAETIAVGINIIRACGLKDEEFNVYINHRGLLNQFISNITEIDPPELIALVDKKMSLYQELAELRLIERGLDSQKSKDQALLLRRIVNSTGLFKERLIEELVEDAKILLDQFEMLTKEALMKKFTEIGLTAKGVERLIEFVSINGKSDQFFSKLELLNLPEGMVDIIDELKELNGYLNDLDVLEPVIYDVSMARGLDYYTGVVYEAFDSTGEVVRALLGGGRYGDLVEIMGGAPLSGVGFGMGETVILELMEIKGTFTNILTEVPDIYIAPIKSEPIPEVIKLATKLRKEFNVLSNPFSWKISRHFELADNKGCKLVLLLGMRDLEQNVVSVRIMETSEKLTIPMDNNLIIELKRLLGQ